MTENVFETFIRHCGTLNQAAKVLGTSREHASAMRQGIIHTKLRYALRIERYMREKANQFIHLHDLLSPYDKYALENLTFPSTEPPIKLIQVSVHNIIFDQEKTESTNKNQINLNALRPVIIDENQQIIANANTFLLYQQQHKKTVPAWRISLPDLLEKKYEPTVLIQAFLSSERTAIGIALENFLGERRGRKNVQNSAHFNFNKGTKTRRFVATYLGFGSHFTYQRAKEIFQQGCGELIEQTDQKKISISKASYLAKLTHEEQKNKLKPN